MLKLKENKGITLIALVITIIVLLILAGITIAQLANSGLFSKVQEAKEMHTLAAQQEELELEISNLKMQMYLDNNNENQTALDNLKTYLESSKFNGEYEVELFYEPLAATTPTNTKPTYAAVTHIPTRFCFYVNGKLVVIGSESVSELKPKFKTVEKAERRIKVTMASETAVEYKYYKSEDGTNYTLVETSENNIYEFTGLTPNTKYYIKVVVKDKNNNEEENIKEITTNTMILSSISVTGLKTDYVVRDTLNLSNAVVTATYENGETKDVTGQTTFSLENGAALETAGTIDMTATYEENGVTKTTDITITVSRIPGDIYPEAIIGTPTMKTWNGGDITVNTLWDNDMGWDSCVKGSGVVVYDLGAEHQITKMKIHERSGGTVPDQWTRTISGSTSSNGPWTALKNDNLRISANTYQWYEYDMTDTSTYRYIKIEINGGYGAIHELRLIGY